MGLTTGMLRLGGGQACLQHPVVQVEALIGFSGAAAAAAQEHGLRLCCTCTPRPGHTVGHVVVLHD